ncbi:ROK family transcriptional regulator [Lentilactobacillus kosonis]|uniref:Xylose-responsive transcription regulator, ROK family n=1 Tax=Lentilactobacillus kosonis TaxID=2810561 RepID=A0A401FIV8_9LACO|nr:ROK family transcriptional regulator [Lentilactobacillus kosonis]GAY72289.1 xylose-responsive transcription regulator, ROK family [Lentilactobacillus kosonis]
MQSSESEFSKSSNYSRILKLIYSNQKISKQEIATSLNLSLPTVTTNLQLLEEDDLIYINGKFKSSVGRRAIAYSINAKKHLSLGLELNKEHINLVALDLNGGEVANSSLSLKFENTDTYFDNVCQWISLFIKMNSFNPDQIIQIGISIPGLISHDGQTVLYGKIMDCTGLTTKVFTDRLPYAIMFFHDADCVAVAEQFLSHSHDDAIYLSINDHIGTAIIINDHIYTGQNGRSGTLEHVKLNADSKRHCYCGRYGCVETYCSINSLLTQNETLDQFMDKLNSEDPDAQKDGILS